MVKIEKMSDNCLAFVNGSQNIFEGQLLTHAEIGTLVLESGILQYSIDEMEIITVDSANSTNLNDSANSTNLNDSANSTNLNDSANSTKPKQVHVPPKPVPTPKPLK